MFEGLGGLEAELARMRLELKAEIMSELEAERDAEPDVRFEFGVPEVDAPGGEPGFPQRSYDPWGWRWDAAAEKVVVWGAAIYSNRDGKWIEKSGETEIAVAADSAVFVYGQYDHATRAVTVAGTTSEADAESVIGDGYQRWKAFEFRRSAAGVFSIWRDWIHCGAVTAEMGA